jgi:hypothetical protein
MIGVPWTDAECRTMSMRAPDAPATAVAIFSMENPYPSDASMIRTHALEDVAPIRRVCALEANPPISRRYAGFAVPTPTFPAGFTNRAVAPVVVLKLATFPAPSCWTDRALPELVLP